MTQHLWLPAVALPAAALHAAGHARAGSTAGWTIAAVVVAALGSAFVAWQAWETHRTTSLSQAALKASHLLAIDSARGRLDQDAPRIDVYVDGVSALPAGAGNTPGSGATPGRRWILPRDGARLLQVQVAVIVRNLMQDRTIHLQVKGLHDADKRADTEVLLVPREQLSYFLTAEHTLDDWAKNWQSHQAGEPLPHIADGRVIARDDRDEGVEDTWRLHLAAWPIQPAEGSVDGTWEMTGAVAGHDWFEIAFRPLRERRYWISQRDGIPMPAPPYQRPYPGP